MRRGIAFTIAVIVLSIGAAASAAAQDADPFERRGWHLELDGRGALEAWNYNISHEELFGMSVGFTYGLRDGLVFTAGWPLTYVSQRGVDALMMGGTFGVRGRLYRRPRWSLFAGGEVGVSDADTYVPPRGTRFNYLAGGGGGVTVRVGPRLHLVGTLQLIHISNAGIEGAGRNPDIEAIGLAIGLIIGF